MAVSASADGNDWYDTDVLPAGAAAGSVQSKGAGNSTATRPITLGIAWKLSGNMWFEKGMLDPTVPLSRTLLDHSGLDANGVKSMRWFLAGTDLQVFDHQTPLEIWRQYNDGDDFSILHLESTKVSRNESDGE